MPWESKSIIEVRQEFVMHACLPNSNIRALCRRFNISPSVGYKTLRRYRAEGEAGLRDHSRKPHHSPSRCPDAVEMAVVAVRSEHPEWGGRKIAAHLRLTSAPWVPAPSTITAILARKGQLMSAPESEGLLWLSALLHRRMSSEDLPRSIIGHVDLPALAERLEHALLRKRSLAILANRRGLRSGVICAFLNIGRQTYRRYVRLFEEGGAAALFAPRINHHRKFDNERIKAALFNVLHQPPNNFNVNRAMDSDSTVVRNESHR